MRNKFEFTPIDATESYEDSRGDQVCITSIEWNDPGCDLSVHRRRFGQFMSADQDIHGDLSLDREGRIWMEVSVGTMGKRPQQRIVVVSDTATMVEDFIRALPINPGDQIVRYESHVNPSSPL